MTKEERQELEQDRQEILDDIRKVKERLSVGNPKLFQKMDNLYNAFADFSIDEFKQMQDMMHS